MNKDPRNFENFNWEYWLFFEAEEVSDEDYVYWQRAQEIFADECERDEAEDRLIYSPTEAEIEQARRDSWM